MCRSAIPHHDDDGGGGGGCAGGSLYDDYGDIITGCESSVPTRRVYPTQVSEERGRENERAREGGRGREERSRAGWRGRARD